MFIIICIVIIIIFVLITIIIIRNSSIYIIVAIIDIIMILDRKRDLHPRSDRASRTAGRSRLDSDRFRERGERCKIRTWADEEHLSCGEEWDQGRWGKGGAGLGDERGDCEVGVKKVGDGGGRGASGRWEVDWVRGRGRRPISLAWVRLGPEGSGREGRGGLLRQDHR